MTLDPEMLVSMLRANVQAGVQRGERASLAALCHLALGLIWIGVCCVGLIVFGKLTAQALNDASDAADTEGCPVAFYAMLDSVISDINGAILAASVGIAPASLIVIGCCVRLVTKPREVFVASCAASIWATVLLLVSLQFTQRASGYLVGSHAVMQLGRCQVAGAWPSTVGITGATWTLVGDFVFLVLATLSLLVYEQRGSTSIEPDFLKAAVRTSVASSVGSMPEGDVELDAVVIQQPVGPEAVGAVAVIMVQPARRASALSQSHEGEGMGQRV